MARKKVTEEEVDYSQVAGEMEQITMEDEVELSMLEYAYYVIEDRSIPDARDGLKPVQRRILYSMHRNGNTPDKPYVKSARIVGDVIGTLHPHGDASTYEAMTALERPFNMMTPFVDGRGNFGDRPGAGAAAARYTEARMTKEALLLTDELKERPVDYTPNYDQSMDEPVVFPAQFPVLPINGVSGMAVGFATNMAPHNPTEIMDATKYLLMNPEATTERLMKFVPGPDFPTGCEIIGIDGIKESYETGRGKVMVRSRYEVEDIGRGKKRIVFYELPYGANSEKIMEQIRNSVKEQKLIGVADAKDLTDRRHGIRLVVETKAGVNAEAVVQKLYRITNLELSFNFNNNALVDGVPTLLGLKDQLQIFLNHRVQVITQRTKHRLKKRKDRMHLIEGLLKALANIDEVIKIVRNADNASAAQANLMTKFKIDEVQADYILAIPLRRLTKFDQLELANEHAQLADEITELNKILDDEGKMKEVIADELAVVKKTIARERRSTIVGVSIEEHKQELKKIESAVSVEAKDEPCVISLLPEGKIARGTAPARGAVSVANTTTRSKFMVVTDKGRGMRVEALHVGEKPHSAATVLPEGLNPGERILAVSEMELADGKKGGLVMGTAKGIIKIQDAKFPKTQEVFDVMGLDDSDTILDVRWVDDIENYDFVFISSASNMLRSPLNKIRPQGSGNAGGVAGFKFEEGKDSILDFSVVSHAEIEAGALVVSVSDAGNAKFTPLKNYPTKGRGTGGVRTLALLKTDTRVAYSTIEVAEPTLRTEDGQTLDALPTDERRDGSGKPLGGVPIRVQ